MTEPTRDPWTAGTSPAEEGKPAGTPDQSRTAPHPSGPPAYPSAMAPDPSAMTPYRPGGIGKVRGTGVSILLFIVTLGIYGLVWYYLVHDEMKRHTGTGLGGGIALLIAFFVGIASPYLASHEVGELYAGRGQDAPVSALTGLWYFPGIFILVGPIVWFVKTNGALNSYWRSMGAPA